MSASGPSGPLVIKYPMKMNSLVSLRPNYFIFVGFKKRGVMRGGLSEPPLDPPDWPFMH